MYRLARRGGRYRYSFSDVDIAKIAKREQVTKTTCARQSDSFVQNPTEPMQAVDQRERWSARCVTLGD